MFLNSLVQAVKVHLPNQLERCRDLDSIVAGLDLGKLRSLSFGLAQDFNKLLDRLFDAQRSYSEFFPFVFVPYDLNGPLRQITQEDLVKWRAAWKSDVRVVLAEEGVAVIAISELAKKYKTTVSQVILAAQQQSYIMLGWDQYQKLLDEIGKLIGEDEESLSETTVMGIPVTTPDSSQEVKVLPKSFPF